jgi:hypothetical protein
MLSVGMGFQHRVKPRSFLRGRSVANQRITFAVRFVLEPTCQSPKDSLIHGLGSSDVPAGTIRGSRHLPQQCEVRRLSCGSDVSRGRGHAAALGSFPIQTLDVTDDKVFGAPTVVSVLDDNIRMDLKSLRWPPLQNGCAEIAEEVGRVIMRADTMLPFAHALENRNHR